MAKNYENVRNVHKKYMLNGAWLFKVNDVSLMLSRKKMSTNILTGISRAPKVFLTRRRILFGYMILILRPHVSQTSAHSLSNSQSLNEHTRYIEETDSARINEHCTSHGSVKSDALILTLINVPRYTCTMSARLLHLGLCASVHSCSKLWEHYYAPDYGCAAIYHTLHLASTSLHT